MDLFTVNIAITIFSFTCQLIYLRWLRIQMAIISSPLYHSLVNVFVHFMAFTFINNFVRALTMRHNERPGLLGRLLGLINLLGQIFGIILNFSLNLFLISSYWSQSNFIWAIILASAQLLTLYRIVVSFFRWLLLPSRRGMALFHFVSTIDLATALVYTIGSPILLPLYIAQQACKLIYSSYAVLLLCSKIGIVKGLSHFSYLWKAGFASIRLSEAMAIIIQNNNHQQYCYSYEYHQLLDVCHQKSANLHLVTHALVQLQKDYDEVLGTAGLKNLLEIWSNQQHGIITSDQQAIEALCQQYHQQYSGVERHRPIRKVATLAEYLSSSCSVKKYALAHYSLRKHFDINKLYSLKGDAQGMRALISRLSHEYHFTLLRHATLSPVLKFFYDHPRHLQWANAIADQYLSGCVNQPILGWLEISAIAHIAQAVNMNEKLERCDYLYTLRQASSLVVHAHPRITPIKHPEAVSRIVRDTHDILFSQGWLTQRWHGVFAVLYYQNDFSQSEQAFLLSTPEKISEDLKALSAQQRLDFLVSEPDWSHIAFSEEELDALKKELLSHSDEKKDDLRQVMFYYSGDCTEEELNLSQKDFIKRYGLFVDLSEDKRTEIVNTLFVEFNRIEQNNSILFQEDITKRTRLLVA